MKCEKCGGLLSTSWNDQDIKFGKVFVLEAECEICKEKYLIAHQIFRTKDVPEGSRLYDELMKVEECDDCPMCLGRNDSEEYFCDGGEKERTIPDMNKIPKWCPLPKLGGVSK